MYLYTKSIAMTLCSVTAALAVALTGLTEEPSTPDASSMPYPASQSQTAGMPDSSTVPGPRYGGQRHFRGAGSRCRAAGRVRVCSHPGY